MYSCSAAFLVRLLTGEPMSKKSKWPFVLYEGPYLGYKQLRVIAVRTYEFAVEVTSRDAMGGCWKRVEELTLSINRDGFNKFILSKLVKEKMNS